jgi:AbrB family looped-hinge helix DNA binding protein
MNYISPVTSKGQITLPKDVRIKSGVIPGKSVRITVDEDNVVRISAPKSIEEIRRLIGMPSGDDPLTAKEIERLTARGLIPKKT